MNTDRLSFKILAAILLTGLLLTVGFLNLRDRLFTAQLADGVFWVESAEGVTAFEVEPGGPAALAGIRPGDRLLSINGLEIGHLGQVSDAWYHLGPGAEASYAVAAGASRRQAAVKIATRPVIGLRDMLRTLLAVLYLGVGLAVAFRAARARRAFHFYMTCLAAFVLFLFSYTPKLETLDWIVYGVSVAAILLLPSLFVHFCLRFPVDKAARRSAAPLLYLPALALGVLHFFWMSGRLASLGLPQTAEASQNLDRLHLVYLYCGLLAGGIILILRRRRATELAVKQQLKWIGYGSIAGVAPFGLIYLLPLLLGYRPSAGMEASMLSLGLIPVAFAYAVIRYRLLDVEVIVRRSSAYVLASTILLAVYLFFVLVVGQVVGAFLPDADFLVVSAAALVLALLFAPVRSAIQNRLDRFFYKDQFEERSSLLEFARTLGSEMSLAPLAHSILERVARTFRLERAALFLADPSQRGIFRLVDTIGMTLPAENISSFGEKEIIEGSGEAADGGSELFGRLRAARAAWRQMGILSLQELRVHGRCGGLIGLGKLPPGRHFSTEDLDLLGALAGYAAIALDNASLYRSVETKAGELARLQAYTENILESINVAVLALDTGGRITSCNRAFEELYGVARVEVKGIGIEGLLPADVIASIHKASGAAGWNLSSPANIFKLFLESRGGEKRIVNLSVIPLPEQSELAGGCLIVMDDITGKVQLESQLMQAEKLSSIGLLAAGIAHEVNTPITGISSYTQMLLKETPQADPRKPILEKIEKQTFRAAEIVTGLLNFARIDGSEFSDLDVNQLIQESITLLEHQLRKSQIRVEATLDGSVPPVYGNSGKLQQVFVNLFLNARDAMQAGGDLRVRTSMNDEMVVVDIEDTGAGISEEDIKRIYDPFFTTKTTGRGTGLGLAVTYGIVQDHGGRILVESAPGRGTHFRLKLPTRHAPVR